MREKLNSLQAKIQADTLTEVIRRAVILYEALLEHETIMVVTKEGKAKELLIHESI